MKLHVFLDFVSCSSYVILWERAPYSHWMGPWSDLFPSRESNPGRSARNWPHFWNIWEYNLFFPVHFFLFRSSSITQILKMVEIYFCKFWEFYFVVLNIRADVWWLQLGFLPDRLSVCSLSSGLMECRVSVRRISIPDSCSRFNFRNFKRGRRRSVSSRQGKRKLFFCNLKLTLYESDPVIAHVNIYFAGSEILTSVVMKSPPSSLSKNKCSVTYFTLVSCLSYFFILKTEAICFFETWAHFQRTTQRYIPEIRTLIYTVFLLLRPEFSPIEQRVCYWRMFSASMAWLMAL
jgi:hypothetical protein